MSKKFLFYFINLFIFLLISPAVILCAIFCGFRIFISTLDKAWDIWKNEYMALNFLFFSVAIFGAYFERMRRR